MGEGRDRSARRGARLLHQHGKPIRVRLRRVRWRAQRISARSRGRWCGVSSRGTSAQRSDLRVLVANSRNVAERIRRYYGRKPMVLHCPVDLERFTRWKRQRRLFRRRVALAAVQENRSRDSRGANGRRDIARCR